MIIRQYLFVFFFGFSASLCAVDRSVDLAFQLQSGSQASISGRVGTGVTGSDSGAVTGTIGAVVVFDEATLKAKEIAFNGGRMFFEDLSFNFSGDVSVPGFGIFTMQATLQSNNLSQTVATISPPGDVTNSDLLIASQHETTLDQGTLSVNATVPALGSNIETENFNTTPEIEPTSGIASITISEQSSNALERVLQFTLISNSTEVESRPIPNTTTFLTLTGTENTESKASVSVPTEFGQWSLDNSVTLISGDEINSSGLAYILVYALGLSPEASSWPVRAFSALGSAPRVGLTLPTAGLNLPLDVEYRETLDSGTWNPLPTVHFESGADSLDQGKTGEATFSFPEASEGFIRFKVRPE
jgi:hypothetical protein